jgi:hypothetical protein
MTGTPAQVTSAHAASAQTASAQAASDGLASLRALAAELARVVLAGR